MVNSQLILRGDIFYVLPTDDKPCGSEQISGRPGIIVSNDKNNRHSTVVEVVYLTKQDKKPLPTHINVMSRGIRSTALCEQIDSISIDRLSNKIGHISDDEMNELNKALMTSLSLQ